MPALNLNDLNNGKKDLDHIADLALSANLTAVDRLGNEKLTTKGAINSLKAFNVRGAFAGGVAYVMKDVYISNGVAYVAVIDHISSTVAADLAASKVTVHQGATREELNAAGGSSLIGFVHAGAGAIPRPTQSKLRGTISVNDFIPLEADTATVDCSPYIQAAFNAAATERARVEFEPKVIYKCNTGLTFDISAIGIEGNGAQLDFTALTNGAAFTPTQSNSDANYRTAFAHINSVDHLFLLGPGGGEGSAVAVLLEDDAGPNVIAGGSFNHCTFMNFGNDVVNRAGSFCFTFNKCAFTLSSGIPTTYSITYPVGTNNGERNMFIDCFWYNRKLVMNCSNGNSSTFFIGCSIDGSGRSFSITDGQVYLIGGHVEYVDDTDYWFHVSTGPNALISLQSVELISQSVKNAFSPFYSDAACVNGGITINGGTFQCGVNAMTVPLIAGTGRNIVKDVTFSFNGTKPTKISDAANQLAYGDFESPSYTGEWTLSNGAVRSSAVARSGTHSLSFPAVGASGINPGANVSIPVTPGKYVIGELWYRTTGLTGSGGTFYVQIGWCDVAGVEIGGSAQLVITADAPAWTRQPLNFLSSAPKGADRKSVV